ncbi:MAG: AMIN domain-containing protein [Methylococcaceae bacterium]|nr:AMIN domain-containing protein [Methylococcaceae bacterium]
MRNVWLLLAFIGLQGFAGWVGAEALAVNSLRYWTQPTTARLVLDTTSAPEQNIQLLHNPPRLVIKLKKASLAHDLGQPSGANAFFAKFNTVLKSNDNLTIIVALKKPVSFKSLTLKPSGGYGHRLVIDVALNDAAVFVSNASAMMDTTKMSGLQASLNDINNARRAKSKLTLSANALEVTKKFDKPAMAVASNQLMVGNRSAFRYLAAPPAKEIIIAIDAGHGGKDPGSHGAAGTQEKRVVFEIAKKLERLIAAQPGMTPVMVRKGDQFIKLRQRMSIARAAKADLFVSIHADAFKNSNVKGASVFTLSNRGATSEAARWLANNENAADFVGGVNLGGKDDILASVLMDLSQTATTEASGNIAKKILANFKGINPLHKSAVQKAGFMVLKSPDIPSILVETAFISNPEEELKLRSDGHQAKIARAIFNGIVGYFKQYAPISVPATRMAEVSQRDNV